MTAPVAAPRTGKCAPPPVQAGFEHIRRHWDPVRAAWRANLAPGEYYVTRNEELIGTVLGSCVSVCLHDPRLRIGGMNHFMLPEGDGTWGGTSASLATRYGSFAMEHLINDLLTLGSRRERLQAKVFGGASVLPGLIDVGARNVEFVRRFLRADGFAVACEDVGGSQARKLIYEPHSGRAFVRKLEHPDRSLARREASYRERITHQPVGGDIELF